MLKIFIFSFFFLLIGPYQTLFAGELLLIGDSHTVGFFGQNLSKTLGAKRYAVGGSSSSNWSQNYICPEGKKCPFVYGYATPSTPTYILQPLPHSFLGLEGLMKKINPETVIIALGTNDANLSSCGLGSIKNMIGLLQIVGNRKCVWVGPPLYKKGPLQESCGQKYNTFVDSMKKQIGTHCQFIDSRDVNDEEGNPIQADAADKVHFTSKLGKIWAEAVAKKILKAD